MSTHEITVEVNGTSVGKQVSSRTLLVSFLRDDVGLTGTHIGCDTSQCGACTVSVDGEIVKSCTLLAVQADGAKVTTIEGHGPRQELTDIQEAFRDAHALHCGFCTPGMIMSAESLLATNPDPTEHDVRHALHGNICRCTGYSNIVQAVLDVAETRRQGAGVLEAEDA